MSIAVWPEATGSNWRPAARIGGHWLELEASCSRQSPTVEMRCIKRTNPSTFGRRVVYEKVAATYFPAFYCSIIGAKGLNFSVRDGKRWTPSLKPPSIS